jgi:hypothetical protein
MGFKTKIPSIQSYYPLWLSGASYSFSGTRLKDNYYDQSGTGNYWVGNHMTLVMQIMLRIMMKHPILIFPGL